MRRIFQVLDDLDPGYHAKPFISEALPDGSGERPIKVGSHKWGFARELAFVPI
jgi:hypothetical protein